MELANTPAPALQAVPWNPVVVRPAGPDHHRAIVGNQRLAALLAHGVDPVDNWNAGPASGSSWDASHTTP